ncbi:hypothetical protein [uncultured Kordia sp.]|uniref:hypothetical protein n=1 Tax=uncultured Kordia sp. TaxID=507699 RepID=UPI00262696A7|nr:hypothetical protein [uncultured Kordia sp.]
MDREHRLTFCKRCDHQKFDSQKGIVCDLTNEIARFYSSCNDFSGDKTAVDRVVKNRELNKIHQEEYGKYGKPPKVTVWTIIRIIALIITLISLFVKLAS